jgi:hypothetical protein
MLFQLNALYLNLQYEYKLVNDTAKKMIHDLGIPQKLVKGRSHDLGIPQNLVKGRSHDT